MTTEHKRRELLGSHLRAKQWPTPCGHQVAEGGTAAVSTDEELLDRRTATTTMRRNIKRQHAQILIGSLFVWEQSISLGRREEIHFNNFLHIIFATGTISQTGRMP